MTTPNEAHAKSAAMNAEPFSAREMARDIAERLCIHAYYLHPHGKVYSPEAEREIQSAASVMAHALTHAHNSGAQPWKGFVEKLAKVECDNRASTTECRSFFSAGDTWRWCYSCRARALLATPALVTPKPCKWLIWSNEHTGWWRPNSSGYTASMKEAGRYDYDEAVDICINARSFGGDRMPPPETMIREDCIELDATPASPSDLSQADGKGEK